MPSQLNPPRVPCVQQTARDPRYADETTGNLFTPAGVPITVVDSVCEVGFTGPFNPPTLGTLLIIGPDECEVGNSAQYRAVMAGKNVEDETYAWTLTNGTGEGNLSLPTNQDVVEANFTSAGTVTIEVTVTSATAGNSPQTASKEVTIS